MAVGEFYAIDAVACETCGTQYSTGSDAPHLLSIMTEDHLIVRDYDRFVAEIAENNRDRDGSSPRFVASSVIASTQRVEDATYAVTINARPYFDGQRVWPKDILLRHEDYPFEPDTNPSSLRALAVDVLQQDLTDYYNRHGWEQAGGTEVQRE